MGISRMVGVLLNVVTLGGWSVVKWIARMFTGDGTRQTFSGRVAVFVIGNLVLSALLGKIGFWTVVKGFGKVSLFFCVLVLNSCGGRGELPEAEEAQVKGFTDALHDRMKKAKEDIAAEKAKVEEDIAQKRRAFEESKLADKAERFRRDAEEATAKKAKEAEEAIARKQREADDQIARGKAEIEARERELLAKAKENIPSPLGMVGSAIKNELSSWTPMENMRNNFARYSGQMIDIECPTCRTEYSFKKENANHAARCNRCNINFALQGVGLTASAPPPPAGISTWITCPGCGLTGAVPGNGRSKEFGCPACNKKYYFLDGALRYAERSRANSLSAAPAPPAPGDPPSPSGSTNYRIAPPRGIPAP